MANIDTGTRLAINHPAQIDGNRQYVRRWDSLEAFAATADECPSNTKASMNDTDFCGGTREDAIRMGSSEGWHDAKPEIERISAHVSRLVDAETISDTFTYQYDVTGSAVDVGRYLEGAPECMVECVPQKVAKRGKVARVLVPMSYGAGTPVEAIKTRGAALVALIDAMSQAHYSIEIWAMSAALSSMKAKNAARHCYAIKLANAGEPYRPEMIAFGVGHSLMLRKLKFLVQDMERSDVIDWFPSRGYADLPRMTDLPEDMRDGPTIILPLLDVRNLYPWDRGEKVIAEWIEEQVSVLTNAEASE